MGSGFPRQQTNRQNKNPATVRSFPDPQITTLSAQRTIPDGDLDDGMGSVECRLV